MGPLLDLRFPKATQVIMKKTIDNYQNALLGPAYKKKEVVKLFCQLILNISITGFFKYKKQKLKYKEFIAILQSLIQCRQKYTVISINITPRLGKMGLNPREV